jgi:hypothetical protein
LALPTPFKTERSAGIPPAFQPPEAYPKPGIAESPFISGFAAVLILHKTAASVPIPNLHDNIIFAQHKTPLGVWKIVDFGGWWQI